MCLNPSARVQQDVVPITTAFALGLERTTTLARNADADKEFWKAALRWSATAEVARLRSESRGVEEWTKDGISREEVKRLPLVASATALENIVLRSGQAPSRAEKERLELGVLVRLLSLWNPNDIAKYKWAHGPCMIASCSHTCCCGQLFARLSCCRPHIASVLLS